MESIDIMKSNLIYFQVGIISSWVSLVLAAISVRFGTSMRFKILSVAIFIVVHAVALFVDSGSDTRRHGGVNLVAYCLESFFVAFGLFYCWLLSVLTKTWRMRYVITVFFFLSIAFGAYVRMDNVRSMHRF